MVLTYLLYISPPPSNSVLLLLAAILVSVLSSKGHISTGCFEKFQLWLLINNRKLRANAQKKVLSASCPDQKKMCFIIKSALHMLVFINDTHHKKNNTKNISMRSNKKWCLWEIRKKTQLSSWLLMKNILHIPEFIWFLMSWAAVFFSSSWPHHTI